MTPQQEKLEMTEIICQCWKILVTVQRELEVLILDFNKNEFSEIQDIEYFRVQNFIEV